MYNTNILAYSILYLNVILINAYLTSVCWNYNTVITHTDVLLPCKILRVHERITLHELE